MAAGETPALEDLAAQSARPERIAELTEELVPKLQMASKAIGKVNSQTRLLSFNAQIEASRAGGGTGAAFGVVASAMRNLADKTASILHTLERETSMANSTLQSIITMLATTVRGTRLSDLALTNIDLIDRNLYERSCDVRWWAADTSCVQALTITSEDSHRYCSSRFSLILNSYTVYYDLVLCDINGNVVANGRPNKYGSIGTNCSETQWFKTAIETKTGEEHGFEGVHRCPLVDGQRVLVYSCCVRTQGSVDGEALGVLGIIFNWDSLAQTIVSATPLEAEEKESSRVVIVDEDGLILADTDGRQLCESIDLKNWAHLKTRGKGYVNTTIDDQKYCVGFAASPGYETYKTGWYSLIMQRE